jgi:hypothetical protein
VDAERVLAMMPRDGKVGADRGEERKKEGGVFTSEKEKGGDGSSSE